VLKESGKPKKIIEVTGDAHEKYIGNSIYK
jgi:hypothetical protein